MLRAVVAMQQAMRDMDRAAKAAAEAAEAAAAAAEAAGAADNAEEADNMAIDVDWVVDAGNASADGDLEAQVSENMTMEANVEMPAAPPSRSRARRRR